MANQHEEHLNKLMQELADRQYASKALGSDEAMLANFHEIIDRRKGQLKEHKVGNLMKYAGSNAGAEHISDLGDGSFAIMWRDTSNDNKPDKPYEVSQRDLNPNITVFRPRAGVSQDLGSKLVKIFKTRPLNMHLGKNGVWTVLRPDDKIKTKSNSEFAQTIKEKDPEAYKQFFKEGFLDSAFEHQTFKGYKATLPKKSEMNVNPYPMAVMTKILDEIDDMNKTGQPVFDKVDTSIGMSSLSEAFKNFSEIETYAKEHGINRSIAAKHYWAKKKKIESEIPLTKEEIKTARAEERKTISQKKGREKFKKIFPSGSDQAQIGSKDSKLRPDTDKEMKRLLKIFAQYGYMPQVKESGITYKINKPLLNVVPEQERNNLQFAKDSNRVVGVRDAGHVAVSNLNKQAYEIMMQSLNLDYSQFEGPLRLVSEGARKVSEQYSDKGIDYDSIFKIGVKAMAEAFRSSNFKTGSELSKVLGRYKRPFEIKEEKQSNILSKAINNALLSGTVDTELSDNLKLDTIFETNPAKLSKEDAELRKTEDKLYGGLYHSVLLTPDDILKNYQARQLGKNKLEYESQGLDWNKHAVALSKGTIEGVHGKGDPHKKAGAVSKSPDEITQLANIAIKMIFKNKGGK